MLKHESTVKKKEKRASGERTRQRLLTALNMVPELRDLLLESYSVDTKRTRIRGLLSNMLAATFEDDPSIPPLEWILTRDAILVFRNILSVRSERLAGFSFLRYLHDHLRQEGKETPVAPGTGFFAELEHLLRGITGRTETYTGKAPAYLTLEGLKAARLRSADLSRMARTARRHMGRYPSGLDDEVRRRRDRNKSRILSYFGAPELEWNNWRWHTRHIIRDLRTLNALVTLTPEEREAVKRACELKLPFGITPHYLSLMDHELGSGNDVAVRAQVIPTLRYVEKLKSYRECGESSMDFMLERDTSPVEGVTRRYPMIVILKPVVTCPQICVYCQRNWEIEDVYSANAVLSKEKLELALQWIADTEEISEVLVTGGDPLLLADAKIENLLLRLARIPHIERIRIGTRTPITLPQRMTDSLVGIVNRFHIPGKREIMLVSHFEHPYEITPAAVEAVQKFRRSGISVYNQLVYTFYNSRKFEATALRNILRLIGVTPYYTFNTKGKEETDDYRVPIPRLLQEQKEEARLLPGSVRTDETVFNVPGLGKNYLRALQHHDVISILPDGRRVYEFHPWEKKLALADTYVYTDVSIYDYLQRLKAAGENIADYKTIWYYY